jgi:hypothetical protein
MVLWRGDTPGLHPGPPGHAWPAGARRHLENDAIRPPNAAQARARLRRQRWQLAGALATVAVIVVLVAAGLLYR